ncbi:MAG: tyrosine-type recombinase/integrase [Myxococcota bacterium]
MSPRVAILSGVRAGDGNVEEEDEDLLSPDEVAALAKACSSSSSSGIRNRALVAMLYRSGLRVAELIALDVPDIDRDERALRPRGSPGRVVCMDAGSFYLVERWIERLQEIGLEATGPLFPTLQGRRLSPSYVRNLLTRLARKAGIEKRVSSKVLRRTLALELAREGFPIGLIQAHLGHASVESTRRLLLQIAPEELAEALRGRSSFRP